MRTFAAVLLVLSISGCEAPPKLRSRRTADAIRPASTITIVATRSSTDSAATAATTACTSMGASNDPGSRTSTTPR